MKFRKTTKVARPAKVPSPPTTLNLWLVGLAQRHLSGVLSSEFGTGDAFGVEKARLAALGPSLTELARHLDRHKYASTSEVGASLEDLPRDSPQVSASARTPFSAVLDRGLALDDHSVLALALQFSRSLPDPAHSAVAAASSAAALVYSCLDALCLPRSPPTTSSDAHVLSLSTGTLLHSLTGATSSTPRGHTNASAQVGASSSSAALHTLELLSACAQAKPRIALLVTLAQLQPKIQWRLHLLCAIRVHLMAGRTDNERAHQGLFAVVLEALAAQFLQPATLLRLLVLPLFEYVEKLKTSAPLRIPILHTLLDFVATFFGCSPDPLVRWLHSSLLPPQCQPAHLLALLRKVMQARKMKGVRAPVYQRTFQLLVANPIFREVRVFSCVSSVCVCVCVCVCQVCVCQVCH
jgi:hypothetical protein